MAEAIFGLIGVLVGAFVTGGWELLMEERRERKAVSRSKRLVTNALYSLWLQTSLVLDQGRAPGMPSVLGQERLWLSTDAWDEHSAVLADDNALPEKDWTALAQVFNGTRALRIFLSKQEPGAAVSPDDLRTIRNAADRMAELYERLTGEPPSLDWPS